MRLALRVGVVLGLLSFAAACGDDSATTSGDGFSIGQAPMTPVATVTQTCDGACDPD